METLLIVCSMEDETAALNCVEGTTKFSAKYISCLYSNAFRRRSIAREIAREMRGGFSMYWLFTNFSVRVIFKTLTEKLFHSDQYCKGFVFSKRGIKFNNKVTILKRAHSLACLKISQLRRHGKKRVHTTESGERRVSSAWTWVKEERVISSVVCGYSRSCRCTLLYIYITYNLQ